MNKNPAIDCFVTACCTFIKMIVDNEYVEFSHAERINMRDYFKRHREMPAVYAVQNCSYLMIDSYHADEMPNSNQLH